MNPVLTVRELTKTFREHGGFFHKKEMTAIKPLSFSLEAGKSLAIVGQNGSGKSTLAKMLVGMVEPSDGEIWINDHRLHFGDYHYRSQQIRMIFQNPQNSLNPTKRIGQILDAPLLLNTDLNVPQRKKQILDTLKQVGLHPEHTNYFPRSLSPGQIQRVALARAMILRPKVIIADETLAALDLYIQSHIVNLILRLQEQHNIAFIFVTQDLGMAKHLSDNLMVLHEGEVIEYGNTAEVLASPLSEVTKKFVLSYFGEGLTADTWRFESIGK